METEAKGEYQKSQKVMERRRRVGMCCALSCDLKLSVLGLDPRLYPSKGRMEYEK
jgi:hypothetical protein